MNTDEIREALDRQADRAPDAQKVRRALAVRAVQHARRRRRRQLIATAVSAAVVPLLLGFAWRVTAGRATSAAATVVAQQRTIPLYYRPTWLPAGVHEATDTMSVDPGRSYESMSRSYTRGEDDPGYADVPSMKLSVFVGDNRLLDVRRSGVDPEPVSVNDIPGTYQKGPDDQLLTWHPDLRTTVMISERGLGLDKAALLRIARSVVPDTGSRAVPLTVGRWPGHLSEGEVTVSASGRAGTASIQAGPVDVTVGPEADRRVPTGGQSLTVDGHPARWVTVAQGDRPLTYLVVALRPRRVLTVVVDNGFDEGPVVNQRDSIRIAESVVVDETWPDWTVLEDNGRPLLTR